MKYWLITDSRVTLDGMRLAGIRGELVSDGAQAEAAVSRVCADESVAVLLMTTNVADWIGETTARLKLSEEKPLLSVIPEPGKAGLGADAITGLIREAIGVKI